MGKFKVGLFISGFFFVMIVFYNASPGYAKNDRVEDVQILVKVSQDGSARITEQRIEHNYTGTERYIIKEKLGKSNVVDFSVSMNGRPFEFIENWDMDASFEEKAYKHGVSQTKDGYELIWGITATGRQEYVIEYTVTNFIKQLKDSQTLYWNFFMEDVPAEKIEVIIEAPKKLDEADESIWGFGFPGDVIFQNGNIIAYNTDQMKDSHYITILAQFRDQIFTTEDELNQTFAELQKEAFKDSDYSPTFKAGMGLMVIIIILFILAVFILAAIFVAFLILGIVKGTIESDKREKFIRKYPGEYYRALPYEGNYLHFYYITYRMGLSNFNTAFTSLLLTWIKEERIRVEEYEEANNSGGAKSKIIIQNKLDGESIDAELFKILNQIARSKGYLTDLDLSRWASRNYNRIDNFETQFMNQSKAALVKDYLVTQREWKLLLYNPTKHELTESGEKSMENTYKFVNYLSDFSLLHEHDAVNVHLWDDLMIWASFLDLTKEVQKQFRELHPQYEGETMLDTPTITSVTALATRADKSRTTARTEAQSMGDSGAGGAASSKGGSGAFGGGRGGGRR